MHRVAGFVGRRCVQSGARKTRHNSRPLSTAGGDGGVSKGPLAAAAVGLTVVGGVGVGVATGIIDVPWKSKQDRMSMNLNLKSSIPDSIPVVSASESSSMIGHEIEHSLQKKKKTRKSETVASAVPASAAAAEKDVASSAAEAVPEDFTALPPSAPPPSAEDVVVSASAEAAAAVEASAPAAEPAEDAVAAEEPTEAIETTIVEESSEEAATKIEEEISVARASNTEYLLEADIVGRMKELELESDAENTLLGNILNEALEESTKAVSAAVVGLADASDMVKNYTILLKKALDDSHPDEKKGAWEKAVGMSLEKDRVLTSATEAYGNAKNAMIIALQAIEGGRHNAKTRDNPELIRVEEKIYRLRGELDDQFLALEKSQSDSRIMKAFTDLVEQGKQQFNAELKSLMPDIRLNETGSKLSEAELNLLIAYAHRWIMQLQRQLAEYQLLEEQHLTDALVKQKAEDESMASSKMREALAEQQGALSLEKERQVTEVRKQAEEDLLSQLKRQAAAHSQHLKEVLAIQEEDYNHRLQTILGEGIAVERRKLENMVRDAFNQLKGIESAIDARVSTEVAARSRQDLWVAVAALKAAIGVEHRVPLSDRVAAVTALTEGDVLVSTLLGAIPEEAKAGGIYSNADLKTRFEKVREICKKVSMVTEEGGIFQTILSFINYKITNESVLIQPAEELNPETDSMLKLVCHAQWYVEHDDLESALRCMNQLRGEPRRTAFDWISEARAALETRQAIDALHSWVSALNIGQFPSDLQQQS